MDDSARISARLVLLENFLKEVNAWRAAWNQGDQAVAADRQSRINRMVMAVKQAVEDAGVGTMAVITGPPSAGGRVHELQLFENLFASVYHKMPVTYAIPAVEQAIGVYESLNAGDGLVRVDSRDALNILTAIERALRPAFRDTPPANEKAVQDEIETILRAVGVEFHREKERAPVGPTSFIPDFTVENQNLAIEVKLANEKHDAAAVQHEIAEDVTAYGSKWKTTLFVVYDCGAIHDPDQFRRENQKHFGVTVLIVKH